MLRKPSIRQRTTTRYAKAVPGGRVQMDTLKAAPGLYRYTAIDDCSHLVAEIYPRRTAVNTLDSFTVPVKCLQTDRGSEFMAFKVQLHLRQLCIKFRPNRPAAPHLNGKVGRVQQTIWHGPYASLDLNQAALANELGVWQMHHNYQRIHGPLGTPPIERFCARTQAAPLWEEVIASYDPT